MTPDNLITLDPFNLTFEEIVEAIRECYNQDYGKIVFENGILTITTGGWFDNEEVIDRLQSNIAFWAMYWRKTERGGKFTFWREQ